MLETYDSLDMPQLSIEFGKIKDIDILLETMLVKAKTLLNADAGSIYITENGNLKIQHTKNDTLEAKLPAGRKLLYSTVVLPVNNKTLAGYVASTGKILKIDNAYAISADMPYSFNKQFDVITGYKTRSILTVPIVSSSNASLGVIQLINAKDDKGNITSFAEPLSDYIMSNFTIYAAAAIERTQMTRNMILRMNKMAALRDPKETGMHVNRVGAYSVEIYEAWAIKKNVPIDEINLNKDILRMAAMLHDIGKIAIPDAILKKPGRLDQDEFEVIKQHTFIGARLFQEKWSDFDEAACLIALNHHERWDGKGYPGHVDLDTGAILASDPDNPKKAKGKSGEEIPVLARVVSVADVYDALIHSRCYKDAWPETKVLDLFREEAGRQFDPDMVDAFFACHDVIKSIMARYPDLEA